MMVLLSILVSTVGAVTTGSIVAWGDNTYGQCNVPAGNDFVAIGSGFNHNIALRADGTIVAWGDNTYGQCEVPYQTDYVAMAAGGNHNIALELGQQTNPVTCWGDNSYGQCNTPALDEYTNLGAGGRFSLAANVNGKVTGWGDNTSGQCGVPSPNNYMYITGGLRHTLATTYGQLAAWGDNSYGECNVPAGDDYIAISAGNGYSVAQHLNRSLACWGDNTYGQCTIPGTNSFLAFDAGDTHMVAVRSDGTLAAWGDNSYGQCNVPAGNGYFAVAGGYHHSIALKKSTTTEITANFSAYPLRGTSPLDVTFTSTSGGSPDTFLYDFGDGSVSQNPNPRHAYSLPGNYTVSLTVTGNNSTDTLTKADYITVLPWQGQKNTLFYLNTIPYGATVYVDGVAVGMTRKAANNLFKATEGVHSLRVTRQGYQEWTGTLEAKWQKIAFYNIKLVPVDTTA
jgi:alpha-tubulin suppressor-like RCC1 family protein